MRFYKNYKWLARWVACAITAGRDPQKTRLRKGSVQVTGRSSVSQLAVALGEQVVPNIIHVLRADGAKLFMGIRVSALKSVDHYVAPVHHAGNPS